MTQFDFEAIGTRWQIDIYTDLNEERGASVLSKIQHCIMLFDKTYSRFRDDSLVAQISKEAGDYILPDDAKYMMEIYHDLYLRTSGSFTPLIGNLISDAGYDSQYSLIQRKELEPSYKWEDVMVYEHPQLKVKVPVLLDFGAAGKGYLIDIVGKVLEENSVENYTIDAGGDILHKNIVPLKVGLENPENTEQVIGVYDLEAGSICGSAGNRRTWGKFTHIMNPETMSSPKDILAVWVVSDTTIIADAIATCLFFVKAAELSGYYEFEYLLIKSDHSIERSDNFKGEIFTS